MEFSLRSVHYLCILFVCVTDVTGIRRQTAITLENNRYQGVLVAIHADVPEDVQLLTSIKEMFKEASAYLNTATGKRAYFGDVTILVPSTWTSNTSWQPVTSEIFSNADIVIKDHKPTLDKSSTGTKTVHPAGAYTLSYGRCGQSGVRIILSTDIFGTNSRTTYGPRGRLLVHEWAHYRWGVFNEHAEEGGQKFYYSPTTRKLEAVRCNINMAGTVTRVDPASGKIEPCEVIDNLTGSFDEACVFNPFITGHINDNISASIMDRQNVPTITHFCNDDQTDPARVHNYETPNRHNRLCGSRSTWSVISQSPDFQGERNPPRDIPDTTPHFRVVQMSRAKRIVLAIDTSGSMEEHNKLMRAVQAAAYFIEDGLEEGVSLGVVSFSTVAKVVSPITELTGEDSRRAITRNLPVKADGETSIGAAILSSLGLLSGRNESATGAFIVLITDGHETSSPTLENVAPAIKEAGAVISVIAFDDDKKRSLEKLTAQTGGRYYFDNRELMSTSPVDAMLDVYRFFDSERGQLPVQIVSWDNYLDRYETMNGHFILDSSLGRNTRVIVSYMTNTAPNVTVTSPSGRRYCFLYPEYSNDAFLKRVKISIPMLAEVGHWTYSVTNNNDGDMSMMTSIVVLSSARDPNIPTLKFSGDIFLENTSWPLKSVIVAEVSRSDVPTTNLMVRAIVTRPMASPAIIELVDNGAGADAVKGDGIYSRFFTRFSTSGQYSVKIEMMNARGDTIVSGGLGSEPPQIAAGYASSVHIEHPNLSFQNSSEESVELDEYPPVRITDLRVIHTSFMNSTVVLAWTAPGDDLDYDKASSYSIVMSSSATAIVQNEFLPVMDNSYIIKGNLDSPKTFGEREEVTLRFNSEFKGKNTSLVFAVFAIDDSGNKGELSNLVTVGFGYVPDLSTQEYLVEVANDKDVVVKAASRGQKVGIACVVGLAAGLLFATIVTTCIIHFVSTRNKQKALQTWFKPVEKCQVV